MSPKTIEFLKHMLGDYMECCIVEYVNDEELDFPFNSEELQDIKTELEQLVEIAELKNA